MHYKVIVWPVVNPLDVPISQVFDWNATSGLLQDVPLLEGTSYRVNVMIGFSDGYAYSDDVFFDWPPLVKTTTIQTTDEAPADGIHCGEFSDPDIEWAPAINETTLDGDLVQGWAFTLKHRDGFADHGCRVVSAADGHPTRTGNYSIRFEVQDGDCNWNDSWDDCTTDRSRHELTQLWKDPTAADYQYHPQYDGDDFWYGWSVYLPDEPLPQGKAVTFIGQFHTETHAPFYIEDFSDGLGYRFNDRNYEFISREVVSPNEAVRGQWNDIAVHVRWSSGEDGLIEIYLNGNQVAELHGSTLDGATQATFDFGIYNAFISECDCDAMPTQVVYYDALRRGATRASVDMSLNNTE